MEEFLNLFKLIIEDNCFIDPGSSLMEGIIVEGGAVISTGVHLTASTKILDKASGEITRGKIPAYSVVVPGVYSSGNVNLIYAVIVKQYDAETKKNFRK